MTQASAIPDASKRMTAEILQALPLQNKLTDTECRTLVLVCEGKTYKVVAAEMRTSEQVIKNRMKFVLDKTGTDNKGELITRLWRWVYEGK
jgi:DNA-binding NarL/FixJ family response regulator